MSLRARNRVAIQAGAPAAAAVSAPGISPALALKSGMMGENVQKIFYSRLLIDPPAGGTVLVRVTFELFAHTRAANPELTNLVEAQRMGPNESFVVEGIAIQPNFGCTEAGLVKLLQDARLRIGIGPDDVERLSVPAAFLPSGNGPIASMNFQDGKAFYRLAKGQEIELKNGHPFSVRLVEGPNAPALVDADVVDLFVKLYGTYTQGIVR